MTAIGIFLAFTSFALASPSAAVGESVQSEAAPEILERVACPAPPGESSVVTVVVQALIGQDGQVRDCRIVKSVPRLDQTAMACVRQYRFAPWQGNGKAVTVWVAVPVQFGAPRDIPLALSKTAPRYPDLAREKNIEGRVVVHALVDRDGRVARCEVKTSVRGLDKAAVESVRQWRFRPAVSGGRPVAMWLDVPIQFTLR